MTLQKAYFLQNIIKYYTLWNKDMDDILYFQCIPSVKIYSYKIISLQELKYEQRENENN